MWRPCMLYVFLAFTALYMWKTFAIEVLECTEGDCYGSWRKPKNCTYDCKYEVGWCVGGEEVTVKVNVATNDGWIGIGFSELMNNISDIVIAGFTSDNDTFIEDRWLIGKGIPQHDTSQDITNASVNRSNGITTMTFTRSRITGDTDHDIELHCQSIFLAWGREAISNNNRIKPLKPKFEEVSSDDDTCFCPTSTVGVTSMPSSKLTPTIPTPIPTLIPTSIPTPMPTPGLCPSCITIVNKCILNATCKRLLDEQWEHCINILEWNEFSNDTEPVCTDKCKEKLVAPEKVFGKEIHCCKCGEITDDHKLSDITTILRCRQIRENVDRWCPNTVNTSCHECEQGSYVTARCLDVLNTCMQDESCKRLMNDMERKCKNVHAWNEYSKNDPTCSDKCFEAEFQLARNPIGNLWTECDCRVPHTQGTFPSLSRNDAFEEQCVQYQRNRRTFCFHEYSCKGQQFNCQWLIDICTKDPTCKQLYDNWNEKCGAFINSTFDSKALPICTDECRKANDDFKKNKIWRRSIDCDCGKLDDSAVLKDIRQTERCLRQRLRFAIFCGKRMSVECPRDPCEPETCSIAYKKCSESDSCERLYENWEEKCIAVWEPTTENCSIECKNATVELYSDLYGQHLRGCDCGMRDLSLHRLLPEEVKCFQRKIKMEEACNIDDTKRSCQNCKAEKVCSHSCDKIKSICTNNTDCNVIWNKYITYCDGVISWDGNSTMPMCTDECKKWIEELENNPIGKHIKCCHCNKVNEAECIRERRNVAIVCDVDFNHVKDCHNDKGFCINDTLKEYEGEKDSDGQEHYTMDDSSLTCRGWEEKCIDDKCCRKLFHDAIYLCGSIYNWVNNSRTMTTAPVCSDKCANALRILNSDHIGKNLRCCTCDKFSDVDHNNLGALKTIERCHAGRINLGKICKTSHTPGCNKLPDTFEDPCTVESCQNALSSCKNNDTCERLYADFVNKCNSVLLPNSTDPVCSHDCKQAIDNLYTNHIGFKLKCCDCGSLNQQNHMTAAHTPQSPDQCFVERIRLIDYCAVSHDECIDCKHKAVVCPQPCTVAREQCHNNSDCNKLLNMFYMECQDVLILDANFSKCTDKCKALLKSRKLYFPKIELLDCCICDDDNCSIQKRNMETLCDIKLDSAEECQNKRKVCEEYNRPKLDHRDQCPPRMCDDCFQKCKNDKLCTRFHNDVHFYCRNVLEWQGDQVEPTCTPVCQMAIDKLALVTTRTMGYNIMCCTCGNYSDVRGNNLIAIRDWENCRRRIRNVKQFCKHNCTDCNKIRPPRQIASCKLTTRLCSEISECKAMKDKINAFCSNVFTWERNTNKRPHCSSECKQAWSAMISSSYGRLQCCDCHHNDMTAREKRQCEQQHRNFEELCNLGMEGMCNDTCNNNQQNKSEALDDCFDHVERCNRDVQCSSHLFNYTNQCAMAFSGEQMTPNQENVCEEAAKKLFAYKQFGENFANCECSAYSELCKELFKNRFLLGKSCNEASGKCRTNATCNKLLNDHNSCILTHSSCSQTCMIKAVLLYRHRFGKAWWKACSPHYFEQVCFKLY